MTDEEIGKIWDANVPILNTENVLAFTRAIEQKVREECAAICEELAFVVKTVGTDEHGLVADACAKAIRAEIFEVRNPANSRARGKE